MTIQDIVNEDINIMPGIGATKHVGSDAYPYYVSEVLPNGVIGLYEPHAQFDDAHPWEGGTQVVDPFDPNHESTTYIKRRYGNWWSCDKNGKHTSKFTCKWVKLLFGQALAYQDPSF